MPDDKQHDTGQDDAVRSINLSTCVGIALYEARRQRTPGSR